MPKRPLGIDVLQAAEERTSKVFDDFERVYVSFSGGKDSGVLYEIAAREARKRGRRLGVLFVDLEAQYKLTIEYIEEMIERNADVSDVFWVSLPLNLRNAVSQFEPQWMSWDPDRTDDWVRQPSKYSITEETYFDFYRRRMEFEELVPEFGKWYSKLEGGEEKSTCCLVGIRSDESLNRYRTIASTSKTTHKGLQWTTWISESLYNAYPIYDFQTADIWTYYAKQETPYNRLYDRMHQAGLSIHQARICQPYGDDQRKGLWLYHMIEPETWPKIVARVNGANMGALYARTSGNVLGQIKIKKPDHLTWKQFAEYLLESMPTPTSEHYKNKIAVFLHWWSREGYPNGIPDEAGANDKTIPSWTRICKVLLRNDYWCKGLSFSQTKPDSYTRYKEIMEKRRKTWNLI